MAKFTAAERTHFKALLEACQTAYDSAMLLRGMEQRSILKTDVAMQQLADALEAAQTIKIETQTRRKKTT